MLRPFRLLLSAISAILIAVGCQDGPPEIQGDLQSQAGGSAGELCAALRNSPDLVNFQQLIQGICVSPTYESLTNGPARYAGSGNPVPLISSQALPENTSSMLMQSSMATSARAATYFEMMKLAKFEPTAFKNRGYEVDEYVTYTQTEKLADRVSFKYENTSQAPEILVQYNATSGFYTLVSEKIYVMANVLNQNLAKETLKDMKALVIAYQGNPGVTTVISVANQLYDNNGNHDTTLQKASEGFAKEIARSYRNSLKAAGDTLLP